MTTESPSEENRQLVTDALDQLQAYKQSILSLLENATREEFNQNLAAFVNWCGEVAHDLINQRELAQAEKVLRECEILLKDKCPLDQVYELGLLYQINNKLAHLANVMGDVPASIKYLEAALESALDKRFQNQHEMPLGETYLNLSNSYFFNQNFAKSADYAQRGFEFSDQIAQRIQEEMHHAAHGSEDELRQMDFALQNHLELKIGNLEAKGNALKSMMKYRDAYKVYKLGRNLTESNLGTHHPLFNQFANAMGEIKRLTKFKSKMDYQVKENPEVKESRPQSVKKSVKKSKSIRNPQSHVQSSVKRITSSTRDTESNKKFKSTKRRDSVPTVMRDKEKNLFLTNCDTWQKVHCHKPMHHERTNLPKIPTYKMKSKKKSRSRSGSSQKSLRNSLTEMAFRKPPVGKNLRQRSSSARSLRLGNQATDILRSVIDPRFPYRLVCKNGPDCKNHDWDKSFPYAKGSLSVKNIRQQSDVKIRKNISFHNSRRSSVKKEIESSRKKSNSSDKKKGHHNDCCSGCNPCGCGHGIGGGEDFNLGQASLMRSFQEQQFAMMNRLMEEQRRHQQQAHQLAMYYNNFMNRPAPLVHPELKHSQSVQISPERRRRDFESEKVNKTTITEGQIFGTGSIPVDKSIQVSHRVEMEQPSPVNACETNSFEKVINSSAYKDQHKSVDFSDKKSSRPQTKSPRSSHHHSRNTSRNHTARSSSKSEKSFRLCNNFKKTWKEKREQAAINIQRRVRGLLQRIEARILKKTNLQQKQILFKRTMNNKQKKLVQLTCLVQVSKQNVEKIFFEIRDHKGKPSEIVINIDRKKFGTLPIEGLRQKLIHICDNCNIEDLAFEFTRDRVIRKLCQTKADDTSDSEEDIPTKSLMTDFDQRRRELDAELMRIKMECQFKPFKVDHINVIGHELLENDESIASDPEESEYNPLLPKQEIEPISIKNVFIKAKCDDHCPKRQRSDSSSSDASQHDYRWEPADQLKIVVERKHNLDKIVRIQCLVRKFLARLRYSSLKARVIFKGTVSHDNSLYNCKLLKNKGKYTLTVQHLESKTEKTQNFDTIPFGDDEASFLFKDFFYVEYFQNRVQKVDLRAPGREIDRNHKFIIKSLKDEEKVYPVLLGEFKLKDRYPVRFYLDFDNAKGSEFYRVELTYSASEKDFVKIKELPVNLKFMLYYLEKQIRVSLNSDNSFSHIGLQFMGAREINDFEKEMQKLWQQIFGAAPTPITKPSFWASRKQSMSKTDEPKIIAEFDIERNEGIVYTVRVLDNPSEEKRYKIEVFQKNKPDNRDYIKMTKISMVKNEFIEFLQKTLRVDIHSNKRITQVSLDMTKQNVFSQTGTLRFGRKKDVNLAASILERPLEKELASCEIEKNGKEYIVQLYKITDPKYEKLLKVSNKENAKDTDWLIFSDLEFNSFQEFIATKLNFDFKPDGSINYLSIQGDGIKNADRQLTAKSVNKKRGQQLAKTLQNWETIQEVHNYKAQQIMLQSSSQEQSTQYRFKKKYARESLKPFTFDTNGVHFLFENFEDLPRLFNYKDTVLLDDVARKAEEKAEKQRLKTITKELDWLNYFSVQKKQICKKIMQAMAVSEKKQVWYLNLKKIRENFEIGQSGDETPYEPVNPKSFKQKDLHESDDFGRASPTSQVDERSQEESPKKLLNQASSGSFRPASRTEKEAANLIVAKSRQKITRNNVGDFKNSQTTVIERDSVSVFYNDKTNLLTLFLRLDKMLNQVSVTIKNESTRQKLTTTETVPEPFVTMVQNNAGQDFESDKALLKALMQELKDRLKEETTFDENEQIDFQKLFELEIELGSFAMDRNVPRFAVDRVQTQAPSPPYKMNRNPSKEEISAEKIQSIYKGFSTRNAVHDQRSQEEKQIARGTKKANGIFYKYSLEFYPSTRDLRLTIVNFNSKKDIVKKQLLPMEIVEAFDGDDQLLLIQAKQWVETFITQKSDDLEVAQGGRLEESVFTL